MFSGYHSTSGLTHKQNGHASWPFSHSQSWRGPRDWKSHIYNANNLSFSEHTVCSHSYCKPMSGVMANLMTSQVHSTHATALVAKKGKKTKQPRKDRGADRHCNLATAVPLLFGQINRSIGTARVKTQTCDHPSQITLKLYIFWWNGFCISTFGCSKLSLLCRASLFLFIDLCLSYNNMEVGVLAKRSYEDFLE